MLVAPTLAAKRAAKTSISEKPHPVLGRGSFRLFWCYRNLESVED